MRIIYIAIFLVAFVSSNAAAQSLVYAQKQEAITEQLFSPVDRKTAFDQVKAEITRLLIKNTTLKSQYASLEKELEDLHRKVEQRKERVERYNQANHGQGLAKVNARDRHQRDKSGYVKRGEIAHNLLMQQGRNAKMSVRLGNIREGKKLWNLRLEELQYQKQALIQELALKESLVKDSMNARQQELQYLRNLYAVNLKKEEKLLQVVEQVQSQGNKVFDESEIVGRENLELEARILQLKMEAEIIGKEQEGLQNKKEFVIQTYQSIAWRKNDQKMRLEVGVNKLELEHRELDEGLKASLEQQRRNSELTRQIIRIDRENQELREKLTESRKSLRDNLN